MPVLGRAAIIRPDGSGQHITESQVLLCRDDAAIEVLNVEPFAWIVLGTEPQRLLPGLRERERTSAVVEADAGLRDIFVSAATASLNVDMRVTAPHFAVWRRGLERLASSLLFSERMGDAQMSPTEDLFSRALRCIEANAADAGFQASDIAERLNVSIGHLYRAFASHETTPRGELLHHRRQLALDLLTEHPPSVEYEEVALKSGFKSARALRSALGQ
ncbi:hypothetical protein [Pseudoclavibacter helvolus]|uniref:helix-turn-helix transcriptional regulator n=1 Tax=Pseudoclavibacter helvolus TaxID=255205 RepID=UPI003C73E254